MLIFRNNVVLLIAVILFAQCIVEPKTLTDEKITAIRKFLMQQTREGFSGCVLLSENDQVLFNQGFGFANREEKIPNNKDTRFEIASVTKLFTTVAILQLVEKGLINLDDRLNEYLGDFEPPKNGATIHHLLTHTAGLVSRGHSLNYDGRSEFVESVKMAPVESIPGEKYRYTNAGYTLLAAIIEEVSGLAYPEYLKENVLEPLGLKHTTFGLDRSDSNFALGYSGRTTDSLKAYETGKLIWGDRGPGGLVTNTQDLHKFLVALQNKNLMREMQLEKMISEQISGEAYGFHVIRKQGIGELLARGGGLPHFESQVVWYLDKNIKLILLINNRLRFRQPVWDGIEQIIFSPE